MAASSADAAAQEPEWRLYYWPGVKGRGEYVRLCFEEAGVPYLDVARALNSEASEGPGGPDWDSVVSTPGFKSIIDFCFTHGADGTHAPVRAPPALARRRPSGGGPDGGEFVLCNTPAILSYLNGELGWSEGLSREDVARVDQILSVILSDAVAEGRLAFHPVNFYDSHKTQVDACGPYIEEYGAKRLPKYVAFLEAALKWNEDRPGGGAGGGTGGGWLVGPRLTAADLCAWHYLCALERHYKEWYDAAVAGAPRVAAFKERVAARPRIAAYLASGRSPPWDKDSLM